jgi:hypothetical protein
VAGQGGVLHRRAIVPARLDGVGACPARINSPVFLLTSLTYNRDRGNKNAVVFPEIGADRFFDSKGCGDGVFRTLVTE